MRQLLLSLALILVIGSISFPAQAYIGPGIVLISYLFGPVIAVVSVVAMILFYPALLLYRKIKGKKDVPKKADAPE